MGKYKKSNEDANIKMGMFNVLKALGIVTEDDLFLISVEVVLNKIDMSGEEWDD